MKSPEKRKQKFNYVLISKIWKDSVYNAVVRKVAFHIQSHLDFNHEIRNGNKSIEH